MRELPSRPFQRDGLTLLSYGALAAYAFCLYAFGPALALLRGELRMSYALIGACSAVWAGGAVLAGAGFVPAVRRLGLRALLWWSAAATAAGAVLLACALVNVLVLAAAGILGLGGTMLQTVTQAALSDRHGPGTGRALVESNIGAGACAVAAPLVLGLLAGTAVGWRPALAIPVAMLGVLGGRFRGLALARPPAGGPGRRLPPAAWWYLWLVAAGIGAEFCVVYFGAELLEHNTGISAVAAAAAMSAFYAGILAGRAGGSPLARVPSRATGLLWASLAVTAAGFAALWLSGQPVAEVTGLFTAGLGIANVFPLSLALALSAAPGRRDTVNGRSQLLGGLTVIAAPLSLGALADRAGLHQAFLIGPLLVIAAAVLLAAGSRAARR